MWHALQKAIFLLCTILRKEKQGKHNWGEVSHRIHAALFTKLRCCTNVAFARLRRSHVIDESCGCWCTIVYLVSLVGALYSAVPGTKFIY
jgi:hypothetical protein